MTPITLDYRATFIPDHYSQTLSGTGMNSELARKDAEAQLKAVVENMRAHESRAVIVSFVRLVPGPFKAPDAPPQMRRRYFAAWSPAPIWRRLLHVVRG